ncbi:MAG: putative metal-dependent hydrolase, partial [Cytophagia bacterium]|nr:putative metal-dependent hydrolase [Cytophagia bacterium]
FATPYREGGWTVQQLIHHIADSHMHAYIRFKWTLTEEKPLIKAYEEKDWAETIDNQLDPALSIAFLTAFHAKWSAMLSLLNDENWKQSYMHPQTQKEITLERMLGLYAWHGKHHLMHIIALKERMQWS